MLVEELKAQLRADHTVYTVDGAVAEVLHRVFESTNPIGFLAVDTISGLAVEQLSTVRVSGQVMLIASICDGTYNIHTICLQLFYNADQKMVQIQNIF